MAKVNSRDMDFAEHEQTYSLFVRLTVGVIIACTMVMVALAAMTVIGGLAFWIGLIGLVVGLIAVAVTLAGGLSWIPSLAVLAAMIVLSALTL